jgi:Domain of unknown function (DUF4265)
MHSWLVRIATHPRAPVTVPKIPHRDMRGHGRLGIGRGKSMSAIGESDFVATHAHPAWRNKANYIFRCRIISDSKEIEWEQMWGREISENTYEVCCIPFFLYGISLGDIVEIDSDKNHKVIDKSDNATIRIWTKGLDSKKKEQLFSDMLEICDNAELHSSDHVALSFKKNQSDSLINFLQQKLTDVDFYYEISDG